MRTAAKTDKRFGERLRLARLARSMQGDAPPLWDRIAWHAAMIRDDPIAAAAGLEAVLAEAPNNLNALLELLRAEARGGDRDRVTKVVNRLRAHPLPIPFWAQRFCTLWRGEPVAMDWDVRLVVDPSVIEPRVLFGFAWGGYEEAEARAARDLVRDGDRVLELGCGTGFVACAALKGKTGVSWRAFEADPDLIPMIEANRALNAVDFTIEAAACGTIDGPVTLYSAEDGFIAASVLDTCGAVGERTVQGVNAARLIADDGANVLIADIEGAEYAILESAPLEGLERILVEFHPALVDDATHTRVLKRLLEAGFTLAGAYSREGVWAFYRH